ncbi:CobW family GTP-binding protein [Spongiibacter tropicus]|uniref:CobW family GTP-binding protein n=1 Tax=Spongiibacter tropicus TaxID=454602 RepID=UPI0003B59737|nr:GTP-binding protein [Spongiibacter tropicus]
MSALHAIPCNVITGFLGAGKTTAILELLKQKPTDERWAVLVNEFGEVGIDGSLYNGSESEANGLFVREVPGGCMCCTAGLPMQIALNRLLTAARPHRLLIEPTGLGHPREILESLSAEHYREVLDLKSTLALVDARKVHDERYTQHASFRQQLAIADVIIANKADLYSDGDLPALMAFLEQIVDLNEKAVYPVAHGQVDTDWLNGAATAAGDTAQHHHHGESPATLDTHALPEQGYVSVDNQGESFFSRGWVFDPAWTFDADRLYQLLLGIRAERIKGVFITARGIVAYNKADEVLSEFELDDTLDSRIECISSDTAAFEGLEAALLDCVVSR